MRRKMTCAMLVCGLAGPLASGPGAQAVAPQAWMENRGQWGEELLFVSRIGERSVGVRQDGLVIEVGEGASRRDLELRFEDASPSVHVEGLEELPGRHHFLVGADRDAWVRDVRLFRGVVWRDLASGVDLHLRASGHGIAFEIAGASGAEDFPLVGSWQESLAELEAQSRLPTSVEVRSGHEERVATMPSASAVAGSPGSPFLWSTYWGGMGSGGSIRDSANQAFLDETTGEVTVAGTVEGVGSLASEGAFQSPILGTDDFFVARFVQATGELVYMSRIGGSGSDRGEGLAVDSLGRATAVGIAGQFSEDFPTTPGSFQPSKLPLTLNGMALRLTTKGDDLEYATFLGPSGTEAWAVALSSSGSAIMAGVTPPSFPTTAGAFTATTGAVFREAFVAKLDPSGSTLEWSGLLGGSGDDFAYGIALDGSENVYITGFASQDLPTTPGAFQTTPGGFFGTVAYVAKISSDGSRLEWSTMLSGDGSDVGRALAVAPDGDVVVGGATGSTNFPITPGAFQATYLGPSGCCGASDAFITRLDATGSSLLFSTYLGSSGPDGIEALFLDASGMVTVSGTTVSADFFVTPGALDAVSGVIKQHDVFVTRLDPHGSRVYYSTRLGGTQEDNGYGLAATAAGRVTAVGSNNGGLFPTTADTALFPTRIGGPNDSFISTFDLDLAGVRRIGNSVPSCLGEVVANATEMPIAGSTTFGLYCTQAPPLASGFLIVSPVSASGEPFPGALSWLRMVKTDAAGFLEAPLGNVPLSKGLSFVARFVFLNPAGCAGTGPLSWSNGVLVTVQ